MNKVMRTVIKIATWLAFAAICIGAFFLQRYVALWQPYDSILMATVFFALSLAVTFSNSYDLEIDKEDEDWLKKHAIRIDAVNIHAHFSWKTVNVWMTLVPVYCTTTVVIISAQPWHKGQAAHIILYSIISLVISLGIYVLKPQEHANHFMKRHRILRKELLRYISKANPSECDREKLIEIMGETQLNNREDSGIIS